MTTTMTIERMTRPELRMVRVLYGASPLSTLPPPATPSL